MNGRIRTAIALGCVAIGASGCAAVLIPVAAGGAIGARHRHHRSHATPSPAPAAPTGASPAPAGATVAPTLPPPVPTDRSKMAVGQAYRGDLPPPTGATPTIAHPVPPPATNAVAAPTAAVVPGGGTWNDMLHFVAAAALDRPVRSVLPTRTSPAATPDWVACGDKPIAVLVDLPGPGTSMLAGSAKDVLSAIETMGVDLVFVSQHPADVGRQLEQIRAAGVSVPNVGQRLFTGPPGQAPAFRATIAARYCVVAVVGSQAASFPNATLPSAIGGNPGWFLIR